MSRGWFAAAGLLLALPLAGHAQDWRTITSARQLQGEEALTVDIEYAGGHLQLRPASGGALYKASLRYDADVMKPEMSYEDGELSIGIGESNLKGRNLKAGQLDLNLARGVPLDLQLKFGAAEADLDLGGLSVQEAHISTGASKTQLRVSRPNPIACRILDIEVGAAQFEASGLGNLNAERLEVSGGVGEVVLDFTGHWNRNMVAEIDMGLGSLTLRVPKGLGVQVKKTGLLAGFDSQGLVKRGDVYYSEDWNHADRRLSINLDAALGSIRLVWADDGFESH